MNELYSFSDAAQKAINKVMTPQANKSAVVSINGFSDAASKAINNTLNKTTAYKSTKKTLGNGITASSVSGYTPTLTRTEADIDKDLQAAKATQKSAKVTLMKAKFNQAKTNLNFLDDSSQKYENAYNAEVDAAQKAYDEASATVQKYNQEKKDLELADIFVEIDNMDASTITKLAKKGSSDKKNPLNTAAEYSASNENGEYRNVKNAETAMAFANPFLGIMANSKIDKDLEEATALNNMTDDQKTIYNALYALDPDKADTYFEYIRDNTGVAQKTASDMVSNIENTTALPGVTKSFASYSTGVKQGGQNLVEGGIDFLTNDSTVKSTPISDQLSAEIRQRSLDENGKSTAATVWYDIMNSTGNMTPGMVASIATGTPMIGDTVFALSQAGGAYREAINSGHTVSQAKAYAIQQGVDEMATDWLLGGIKTLGGNGLEAILKGTKAEAALLKGLDKIAKTSTGKQLLGKAMSYVASAGKEGTQEFIQYFTEGLGKEILLNEDFDPDMDEAWYSAMVGVLNAFMLNAKAPISSVTNLQKDSDITTEYSEKLTNDETNYANEDTLKSAQRLKGISDEIQQRRDKGKKASLAQRFAYGSAQSDFLGNVATSKMNGELSEAEFNEKVDALANGFGGEGNTAFREKAKSIEKNDNAIHKLFKEFATEYNKSYVEETGEEYKAPEQKKTLLEKAKALVKPEETILNKEDILKATKAAKSDFSNDSIEDQKRIDTLQKALNSVSNTIRQFYPGSSFFKGGRSNKTGTANRGGIDFSKLDSQRQADALIIEDFLTKRLGINVKWVRSELTDGKYEGKNGSYNPATNTITLDVNAGAISEGDVAKYNTVLSHELTHWMEMFSPKAYRELKNIVVGNQKDLAGTVAVGVKLLAKDYTEGSNEEATRDNSISELVARTCEDALGNSEKARELLKEMSPEAKEEVQKHLTEIDKEADEYFDEVLSMYESDSAEAKALKKNKGEFDRVMSSWNNAFEEGAEIQNKLSYIEEDEEEDEEEEEKSFTETEKKELLDKAVSDIVDLGATEEAFDEVLSDEVYDDLTANDREYINYNIELEQKVRDAVKDIENGNTKNLSENYDEAVLAEAAKRTNTDANLDSEQNTFEYEAQGFKPSGDVKQKTIDDALKYGTVRVYANEPIVEGTHISLSQKATSEKGQVYVKTIKINDASWGDSLKTGVYGTSESSKSEVAYYKEAKPLSKAAELTHMTDAEAKKTLKKKERAEKRKKAKAEAKASNGEEKNSFRGETTVKLSDIIDISTAKAMDKKGVDSETIRQKTGWFKGMDGKWRNEVDDHNMRIKLSKSDVKARNTFKLEDVLSHDKLYELYPNLKSIDVEFSNELGNYYGKHRPGKILLSDKLETANQIAYVLIHEIQHEIQNTEGFAKGSNVERMEHSGYQYDNEYKKANDAINGIIDKAMTKKAKEDIRNYAYLMNQPSLDDGDKARIKEIEDRAKSGLYKYTNLLNESVSAYSDLVKAKDNAENKSGEEQYWNTAGEIEARDVSNRMRLTEEGRKHRRPDIDNTDATVISDSNNNASGETDKNSIPVPKEDSGEKYSTRILMGSEFSGGGMLESGLVYKMLDHEFGVEWDNNIAAVYRENHGDHIYAGKDDGDVHNFDISKHKDIFYFHASPVCHDFSKAKHGAEELESDRKAARKVASDIEIAKPPVVTIENAPEYIRSESLKIIEDKLNELGYEVRIGIYNAADYGAATSRERCILTAVKSGMELPDVPETQDRTNSWDKVTKSLWEGLDPSEAENGNPIPDYLLKAMRKTKKLQGIFNEDGTITVDKPLLVITTTNGGEATFAWEGKLCPTLTTKCGEGHLILPGEHISLETPNDNIKKVTPEFMGRIQGLPEDFNYGKYKTKAFTIVGNGIPTQLTKAVIGGTLESAYQQAYDEELNSTRITEDELQQAKDRLLGSNDDTDRKVAELLEKYGALPKGEKAVSHIGETPKKSSDSEYVRQYVKNFVESGKVDDATYKVIEEELSKGELSYHRISDEYALKYADEVISKKGVEGARKEWDKLHDRGTKMDKPDLAVGEALLLKYAEAGDSENVFKMVSQISAEGTRAGQEVQALRLLKKWATSNPQIGLAYIKETVDSMSKKHKKDLKINEEYAEEYLKSTTTEEADVARAKIYKDVADQLPNTIADRLNAWRYIAMLGNPRTMVRNFVGNAVFAPAVMMKNAIAYGLEQTTGIEDKTKAIHVDEAAVEFAKEDYKVMKDEITGESTTSIEGDIEKAKERFKTKPLQTVDKGVKWTLDNKYFGDEAFLKKYYTNALAQYMTANNLTADDMKGKTLAKAREIAVKEAQKNTYRDASAIAKWLQGSSKLQKGVRMLIEGVMPFKKTPVNILKRGLEYSPLGLAKTLVIDLGVASVKNSQLDSKYQTKVWNAQTADSVASGITGTAITALGIILANLGLVQGKYGDDDEETLENLKGNQEYSFKIGDKSYTIDWAAPAALPFFVGVQISDLLNERNHEIDRVEVLEQLATIADPMQDLSMLEGINNAIEAAQYTEGSAIGTIAISSAFNYVGQFVPTLLGQIARTVDRTRRINYTGDVDSAMGKSIKYLGTKILNKIPGFSLLSDPYLDEWGREDTNDSIIGAAIENFLSPGYISDLNDDAVTNEVERVSASDDKVVPSKVKKYYKVDGQTVKLTSSEWTLYQKTAGNASYATLEQMFKDKRYDNLTDLQKADAISYAYEYSKAIGRKAIQDDYELDKWIQKASKSGNVYDYILKKVNHDIVDDSIPEGANGISTVAKSNFTDEQKSNWLQNTTTAESKSYKAWNGTDADYIKYKAKLDSFSGDDKQADVIAYIKTQPKSKWKDLWLLAGYKETTFDKNFSEDTAKKLAAPELKTELKKTELKTPALRLKKP